MSFARHRTSTTLFLLALSLPAAAPAVADGRSHRATAVQERTGAVTGTRAFRFARPVTHVAVHWRGQRTADVHLALSRDGRRFGPSAHVDLDEVGRRARDGETYGKLVVARGVRAVRLRSDRRLRRATVLGFTDAGSRSTAMRAAAQVSPGGVVPRSGWGADESLRFDRRGQEIWPPVFWPVQKLVVHHTAGANDDPDPAATIRSIYRYHAVTQGWGDIGYNFLVDEAGRVFEGRYSGPAGDPDPDDDLTPGEDGALNGVTAGHAYGYNSATVGVALLGTLSDDDAEAAARTTLEELLAWGAERHGLNPLGEGVYDNPATEPQENRVLPHIFGHRDVSATECPGEFLHATLQALREGTGARLSRTDHSTFRLSAAPAKTTVAVGGRSEPVQVSLERIAGFEGVAHLRARGLPAGSSVSFASSTLGPDDATTLTIAAPSDRRTVGTYLLRVEGSAERGDSLVDTRAATVAVEITRR